MLRRFLACLALLTGLAAAGAPAQAEVAMALAPRMEASTAGQTDSRRASVAVAAPLAVRQEFRIAALVDPMPDAPAAQPTVRLRSDRARE